MARSHQKPFNSKMLCGIFLSAAMALSGCGGTAQPANDNNPAPHQPHENADLTTVSFGDKFLTGEEKLNQPVRFSEIAKDADPRMQRLIAQLQRSSLGRDLYNYAAGEKISLEWESADDKRAGVYYHEKDLIVLDARGPDDGLLSTLVHEIRHTWQYRKLGVTNWTLSPQDRWRASRLVEADSCAFSVHFAAVYEKETGHRLDATNNFNRLLTEAYMYTPVDQRNYITGAVEPCFERIKIIYDDLHMETVTNYFNRSAKTYADVAGSSSARKHRRAFEAAFNTPDNSEKAVLFSAFMSLTLDPKSGIVQDIQNLSADDFLAWLDRQTPVDSPADAAAINRMQTEFNAMRDRLLHGPVRPMPDQPEAPAPSNGPFI